MNGQQGLNRPQANMSRPPWPNYGQNVAGPGANVNMGPPGGYAPPYNFQGPPAAGPRPSFPSQPPLLNGPPQRQFSPLGTPVSNVSPALGHPGLGPVGGFPQANPGPPRVPPGPPTGAPTVPPTSVKQEPLSPGQLFAPLPGPPISQPPLSRFPPPVCELPRSAFQVQPPRPSLSSQRPPGMIQNGPPPQKGMPVIPNIPSGGHLPQAPIMGPPVTQNGPSGPQQARRPMYPPTTQPQQFNQGSTTNQFVPPATNPHSSTAGYPTTHFENGPSGEYMYSAQNGQNGNMANAHGMGDLQGGMAGMSVRDGMNKMWGNEPVNLLQERDVLTKEPAEEMTSRNCAPEVFQCTMTKIPETSSLLQKSRLPLGILLQPFRDLKNLPVIQTSTIVRCRSCRTYINPFIQFIDRSRWKCNICFRLNDIPTDFLQDPSTGRYGDPELRPEIQNGTVEYIAPSEYMVRPPQAAVYLFLMDTSFCAVETGYLKVASEIIESCLDSLPGDARTQIGFVTFDTSVHFYGIDPSSNTPRQMVVTDIEDVFIPTPDTLLCNLNECKPQIRELLSHLAKTTVGGAGNCLGAALQAAYKLLFPIGGRVTVFQSSLPNMGPGALEARENPNERSAKEVVNLNPATDFYKKLALDCSGQQIGVDLFLLSSQFADLATLAGISKFSSGQVHFYPRFHVTQSPDQLERFSNELEHYLTRKIGFEAVMRIRCTKGLQMHTFHGNFFVRSTDLLSLPNVNPDAGFAMQIAIEENLTDCNAAVFQAALLYTSSSGERRIRVHTLCVPVSALLGDILHSADQDAVVGLLAKMAVDRTLTSSVMDARDAMINAAADLCHAYSLTLRSSAGLPIMRNAKALPLLVLGLLKQRAFRVGVSTKLDERIFDMERIKNLPLEQLLLLIYPALYPLHLPGEPQQVQLSFEKIDKNGLYLLDTVDCVFIYVGGRLSQQLLQNIFGVAKFSQLPDHMDSLPELENEDSSRIRGFVDSIQSKRSVSPPVRVIREDSQIRNLVTQYMINDRGESVLSYYEFLQHLRNLLDSY